MNDPAPDSPVIDYPCSWSYRVVGEDESALREAVARCVGARDHELAASNVSRTGRYVSLKLTCTVESEADRHAVYEALCVDPAIRHVL